MNDMKAALEKAGVPVPTTAERIWKLLKEEPNIDYMRVSEALNLSHGNTSSALSDLVVRGMVRMTKPLTPVGGGRRPRRTYEALGRVYALLPRNNSVHAVKYAAAKRAAAAPPVVKLPAPESVKEWSAEDHVNALTLKQAKEVFAYLKEIFG